MIASCAVLMLALSKHVGSVGEYNEVHPSLGVACEQSPVGAWSGGYYYNSEKDHTVWAALRRHAEPVLPGVRPYAELGGVAGYKVAPVLPFARIGAELSVPRSRVGLEVFAMPGFESVNGRANFFPLLGVQLRFD